MREIWICRYSSRVEAELINLSVYGTSVSQVCASLAAKEFRDSLTGGSLGRLLISVQVMGIEHFFDFYNDRITETIQQEHNFIGLCRLLGDLDYLFNMQLIMEKSGVHPALPKWINKTFELAVNRLTDCKNTSADEEETVCEQLKNLYSFSADHSSDSPTELFNRTIAEVLEDTFCNSRFYGTCLAIHYKQGAISVSEYGDRIGNYLESVVSRPEDAASFICGIFLIGRDALFSNPELTNRIDRIIASMSNEVFISVLPNLRYAFTSFLPSEINRIGTFITDKYRVSETDFSGSSVITREELLMGMQSDQLALEQLKKWRMTDG